MSDFNFFNKTLYFKNIFDVYNMDFSPSIIGYEVCNKNKPEIESNKSCYLIHFVLKGEGYLKDNLSIKHIRENDCFIINPHSHAKYKPNSNDPWAYIWVEINGELAKKIFENINFKDNDNCIHLDYIEELMPLFYELFDDSKVGLNHASESLRVNACLFKIFSIILSKNSVEDTKIGLSRKEIQVKQIIEYLNANFTSPDISISTVARHFYFNQSYLTRIFKESTGISPIRYIIVLRMRRAVELLERKNFSISQIAYALGYKNQFYFSKEFKKYFGVQPSKYGK